MELLQVNLNYCVEHYQVTPNNGNWLADKAGAEAIKVTSGLTRILSTLRL